MEKIVSTSTRALIDTSLQTRMAVFPVLPAFITAFGKYLAKGIFEIQIDGDSSPPKK